MTVDKRGEIQISHHAEDVDSKEVAAEKDASVKAVKLDKEVEQEKDFNEAIITKKKRKIFDLLSVSLIVDKRGEMEIQNGIEEVEKNASKIHASGKGVEFGKEAEQEQDITEAVLVLVQIQIEEKIFIVSVRGRNNCQ